MNLDVQNFIGGRWVDPARGRWLENIEPATGERIGRVPDSDADDIANAVESAASVSAKWAATPNTERAALLNRLADWIEREQSRSERKL